MAWSSIRHRSVEAVIFLRSRGEYVQYARGNSSTLWSKRVMGGEATDPSKPKSSWILRSLDFGRDELDSSGDWSQVWRKQGIASLYVPVMIVWAVCRSAEWLLLRKEIHMWPSRHISSHLNFAFGFPARVNVSGCWFWEGQWEDQAWRGRDTRVDLLCRGSVNQDFWAHWIHRWSRSVVYGCWLKFVGIVCTSENSAEACYRKDQTIRRTKARNRKCEANFCRTTTSLTTPCCLESMKRMARMGRYGKGSKGE